MAAEAEAGEVDAAPASCAGGLGLKSSTSRQHNPTPMKTNLRWMVAVVAVAVLSHPTHRCQNG